MRLRLYFLALVLALLSTRAGQAQAPPAGFTSTVVSSGWDEAVGLTFTKTGDKMFVWERPGRVWVVVGGQRQLVLDISPEVGGWDDHGLLGFALDPNFDSNGFMYLLYVVDRHYLLNFGTPAYSATANDYNSATIGRLTRYTATPAGTGYTVNQASRRILLGATKSTGIASTSGGHVVGSLVFGTDGTLLVSTGDGAHWAPDLGSFNETYYAEALADGILSQKENVGALRSQLVDCLNGKILRLDPATGQGIPSNPFYDAAAPDAPRSKVWTMGTRTPFRMSLRLGTGSTDPTAANPGAIYLGMVGGSNWEEIAVIDRPRVNLGWPLFEGLTPNNDFINANVFNRDALNPLFNTGGCTQQFFYFRNLIKAATPSGTATFTNPCDNTKTIPASIPTFVHTRPIIDWGHGAGPSRTGTFSGSTPTTANIGAAGSPVSGPQFGGNSATGGVFYPYNDFPAPFSNAYFFGDYVGGWIRSLTVNSANQPSAVANFVNSNVVPVAFAVSPAETGLFYVNFYPSEIRKISFGTSNVPPVAVISADNTFGPGPLSVQFTGSGSSNPGGGSLSYRWDFGDGTPTSSAVNPAHTFFPPSSAPIQYTVTLTVTNSQGLSHQATRSISVNNTPPQVTITSPAAGTRYPLTGNTTYELRATVTDAEHTPAQLRYQWQTILHHDTHQHPNPIDPTPQTTTTLEPNGCGAETYYYRITLTVTDAAGLATTREVRLDPDCTTLPSFTLVNADTDHGMQALSNGAVLNLAALPTRNLNIRANIPPAGTGSVVFSLSGAQSRSQTENVPPYALFSDSNGDYNAWTPAVGSYSLTATPYSGAGGTGTPGTPLSVSFSVTDGGTPGPFTLTTPVSGTGTVSRNPDAATYAGGTGVTLTASPGSGQQFTGWSGDVTSTANPLTVTMSANRTITATFVPLPTGGQAVTSFTLINADSDQPLQALSNGAVLNLATLPTQNLNLRANTSPAAVGSVVLALSGTQTRTQTETSPPYALFGDAGGDYNAWTPATGSYSLTATPYSSPGGTGTPGTPLTISFSVTNQPGGGNVPPVANAGPDKTLTLPTTSTVLNGSGSDDGSVVGFAWSQVSGPTTATFSSATTAAPTVSALGAGTYVFSLVVTDNLGLASAADQVTVTVNPAPVGGAFTFYRALNLNGSALTLDGNPWQGSSAPNYSTTGTPFTNTTTALLPATDAPRTGMIRSSVFGFGSVSVTLTAVPAGSYQVYTYVWEDNNPEVFSVTLNGQTVRANYNSGPAGTWARLGPFAATLTAPGALVVGATGGAANFSGIEVWRLTTTPAPAPALTAVALYPNPSPTARYVLQVPAELGPQLTYSLVSAMGRVVAQGELRLEPGSQRTSLDLAGLGLPPGMYQLRLSGNRQQALVKLMR